MSRNVLPNVLVIVAALALVAVLVALFLWISRTDATEPRLTATAVMVSESGADVGAVAFHQEGDRVLVMVDVHGLAPGGHSITVHAVAPVPLTSPPPATTSRPARADGALYTPTGKANRNTANTAATCPTSTPMTTVPPGPTSSPTDLPCWPARIIHCSTKTAHQS